VEAWKQIILTRPQQLEMAIQAMELKPRDAIKPAKLLTACREVDYTDAEGHRSLWVTLNTIEESIIRGGLTGRNERGRRIRTRPIR
jgi:hypothetical protein